jgi:hypothetical protein
LCNENDIIYNYLIKYINIQKHELFEELPKNKKELQIEITVYSKTIINLFSHKMYNNNNIKQIKLDDEIIEDKFYILFSYEYYIIYDNNDDDSDENCDSLSYEKIENNIKNCNNIIDKINNNPYQIIFIDCDNKNYEEIYKLVIQKMRIFYNASNFKLKKFVN